METAPVNPAIQPKPPIVTAVFALAGWGLNRAAPLSSLPDTPLESMIGGGLIAGIAGALFVLAAREMAVARTTILPGGTAAALVRTGVFARSRNPIYLGFVLLLIGIGVATVNGWMIVMAGLLALYLTARVIRREEGYLQARFGDEYSDYRRRVRRWF